MTLIVLATRGLSIVAATARLLAAGAGLRGGGDVSVTEALAAELEAWPDALADSTLAATAKALAAELDSKTSATSKAMCAKALSDLMAQLRELAPDEKGGDRLDDLAERRAARLAG
jgi:hypothetical protein